MKTKLFFLSTFLTFSAFAIQWEVIGQESKKPVYSGSLDADLTKSLGEISVKIFEERYIPYIGNDAGMNSILGTPTGDAAIVIVNDETMRVYGWCYQVDGKIPELMPNKFFFSNQNQKLIWFFAYSLYEKGTWTKYCAPAWELPLK